MTEPQGEAAARPAREALEVTVREARESDFPELSRVMARAFYQDPVTNWMVKQDAHRRRHIARIMHLAAHTICFQRGTCLTTEGLYGGALSFAPGEWKLGLTEQVRYLPVYVKSVGGRRLVPVLHGVHMVEKVHPNEPHYYMLAAGVDTGHQGKGIGTQLMRPILDRCDAEHMPAYLESTHIRNNPLYERLGYKVMEVLDVPHGGPRVWCMWREPQ